MLKQNSEDGGDRRCIVVQLPEPLPNAGDGHLKTIADITKERVRRVIQKLNNEDAGKLDLDGDNKQDRGFRVFKLDESNFKPWNAEVPHDTAALKDQLDMHVEHIREGRAADDILYELLLKSGYPLTTPVETLTLAGQTVHSVADGALFICLEQELTLELIRAMALPQARAWSVSMKASLTTTSSKPMQCKSSRPRALPVSRRYKGELMIGDLYLEATIRKFRIVRVKLESPVASVVKESFTTDANGKNYRICVQLLMICQLSGELDTRAVWETQFQLIEKFE